MSYQILELTKIRRFKWKCVARYGSLRYVFVSYSEKGVLKKTNKYFNGA
jgi:hypothetical protein